MEMEIIFFAEEKEKEEDIWIRKRRKGTENEKEEDIMEKKELLWHGWTDGHVQY